MSKIPLSLIAILSEILSEYETHATLDNLFLYADINSEIPNVSKPAKVQQVLMEVNKANIEPLKVLGRILEKYLDGGVLYVRDQEKFNKQIENIKKILSDNSLLYITGGIISGSLTTPPCSEGVRWLVMKTPVTLSEQQLKQFTTVMHHDNNRPVQPLHGRVIVE